MHGVSLSKNSTWARPSPAYIFAGSWVEFEISSTALPFHPGSTPYIQLFAVSDGTGRLGCDANGSSFYSSNDIMGVTSDFKHIVLTYDGTDATLYVNAGQVGSVSGGTAFNSEGPLYVGVHGGYPALPGDYDEVRVYNFGLSAEQVQYLYAGKVCVSSPALDLDGDCQVSLSDLAAIAGVWLENGFSSDSPELA